MEGEDSSISPEDEGDERETDPKSSETDPFEVVLRGGSPWGFTLCGGSEVRTPLQISEIEPAGKAANNGSLQVADYILSINDIHCASLTEAVQLIQSAFRTLTLGAWRGTLESGSRLKSSPSFLEKAREIQQDRERSRRLGTQDDSIVFKESKSSFGLKMKPRQRRIESFHGGRRTSANTGTTSVTTTTTSSISQLRSPDYENQADISPPNTSNPPGTVGTSNSTKLREWATEQDLSLQKSPRKADGNKDNNERRNNPLSPAKSTPLLSQLDDATPYRQNSVTNLQTPTMYAAKSSPNVNDELRTNNWNSPRSPQSPPWYPPKTSGQNLFEFASSSPRSSWARYGEQQKAFESSYAQNDNRLLSDDMSARTPSSASKLQRRSLPPQFLSPAPYRHDYQNLSDFHKPEPQKPPPPLPLSMPPTQEEEESDSELPEIPPRPPEEIIMDPRPPCSPPAPPVRDLSSFKYLRGNQNHEKYPSWPVHTEQEVSPPVDSKSSNTGKNNSNSGREFPKRQVLAYKPQLRPLKERNSPKSFEENKPQLRNASDPGFKAPAPLTSLYKTRRIPVEKESKENDYENVGNDHFEDFYNNTKPGYQPPRFDSDGHNLGDEKYSIPSPPERDQPADLDQKTLSEKIASIISPTYSQNRHSFTYNSQHRFSGEFKKVESGTSPLQSPSEPKFQGLYSYRDGRSNNIPSESFQQSTGLGLKMVDSSTSPLQSPNDPKSPSTFQDYRDSTKGGPSKFTRESQRGYIVKQMPCYNTSTQTDEVAASTKQHSPSESQQVDKNGSQRSAEGKFFQEKGTKPGPLVQNSYVDNNYRNSGDGGQRVSDGGLKQSSDTHYGARDAENKHSFDTDRRSSSVEYKPSVDSDFRSSRNSVGLNQAPGDENHKKIPEHPKSDYSKESSKYSANSVSPMHEYTSNEYAPMLRQLSREYVRGNLHGYAEKRLSSSSSSHDGGLRSPGHSDYSHLPGQYGVMREAESYNSVIIHPSESSSPFERDYYGSSASIASSRHDMFSNDGDASSVTSRPGRHSLDPTLFSPRFSGDFTPRSLADSRFNSVSALPSQNYSSIREHSRSVSSIETRSNKTGSSSEDKQRLSQLGSESSVPSQPRSSVGTRSSGSTNFGESPTSASSSNWTNNKGSRVDSYDSVFMDDKSPSAFNSPKDSTKDILSKSASADSQLPVNSVPVVGRSNSMKKAYGTYEDPFLHRRQDSDTALNSSHSRDTRNMYHGRSQSYSDYMSMDYSKSHHLADSKRLGLIREDSSEPRWDESIQKSKSLPREIVNYESVPSTQYPVRKEKNENVNDENLETKKDINEHVPGNGLKRVASEKVRPWKDRNRERAEKHKYSELDNLNSTESVDPVSEVDPLAPKLAKYDSKDKISLGLSQSQLDRELGEADLKTVQQRAVMDFMEYKTGKKNTSPPSDKPPSAWGALSKSVSESQQQLSPRKQDIYGKARPGLRRSQSTSSNSSSTADYVEMTRPDRPHLHAQTEWSRLRSITGEGTRRPLSIGSDSSTSNIDAYAISSNTARFPFRNVKQDENHQRSQSDSAFLSQPPPQGHPGPPGERVPLSSVTAEQKHSPGDNPAMVASPIYQNIGMRKPPPPPPDEDQPPALPPRNYRSRQLPSSQSESSLQGHSPIQNSHSQSDSNLHPKPDSPNVEVTDQEDPKMDFKSLFHQWENSPREDSYAQQLRQKARKMSIPQQYLPTPMTTISTRTQISVTQSFKREPVKALEATTPQSSMSSEASFNQDETEVLKPVEHGSADTSLPLEQARQSPVPAPRRGSPFEQSRHSPVPAVRRASPLLTGHSPVPPPPPTPPRMAEQEFKPIEPELPPPPPELLGDLPVVPNDGGEGNYEESDRFADDSYAGHVSKSRTVRQPGVYTRSSSASDALKTLTENNNYKEQTDINRQYKLNYSASHNESRVSPTNAPRITSTEKSGVPVFKAAESVPGRSVLKTKALPLLRPLGNSHSASVLPDRTPIVENSRNSNTPAGVNNRDKVIGSDKTSDKSKASVRDRILNFETTTKAELSRSTPPRGTPEGHSRVTLEESVKSPESPSNVHVKGPEVPQHQGSKLSVSVHETRPVPLLSRSHRSSGDNTKLQNSLVDRPGRYGNSSYSHHRNDVQENSDTPSRNQALSHEVSKFSGSSTNRNNSYAASTSPILTKGDGALELRGDNSPRQWKSNSYREREELSQRHRDSFEQKGYMRSREGDRRLHERQDYNSEDSWLVPVDQVTSPEQSSQADDTALNCDTDTTDVIHIRQPSQEELDCDQKAQELAIELGDSDKKLSEVLKHDTKSRMDFMNGLFPVVTDTTSTGPRHSPQASLAAGQKSAKEKQGSVDNSSQEMEKRQEDKKDNSPLPATYWVSSPKAMMEMEIRNCEEEGTLTDFTKDIDNSDGLVKKKEELMERIVKKIDILREEKEELMKEIDENNALGEQLKIVVDQKCRSQQEKDKFKSYCEDLEKIVRLLLKLSGLLARAENAVQSLAPKADEKQKKIALDKRDRLYQQHEDAKTLKEDIDKRSEQVSNFLKGSLSENERDDYNYFVKMKSKLTIQMQELEDKITLGEEQMQALKKSVPDS